MPYKLEGKCVVRADTGETIKCHNTEAEAKAHLAALEINVEKGVNMENFSYFIPLEKVVEQDDGSCLIYGTGVQEEPDVSGEIFDYDSSVPLLQKWSEAAFKRSGGKSYGNVRAMHGKQASGLVAQPLSYDPKLKKVNLVVKVVDPVDVRKSREGVYTGFSIGGRYVRKWPDAKLPGSMRYTAEPMEFSLVDMPNVRNATFDLVKVGGDVEVVKFAPSEAVSPDVEQGMFKLPGSEYIAPDPDAVPRADVPGGEYIVKNGVANASDAPNSLAHGIELLHPAQVEVPAWLKPMEAELKKLSDERQAKLEATKASEVLLKAAGLQTGISRREGEAVEPPVGYPTDLSEYGDPANWAWRYDIGEFAKAAVIQYNLRKNRDRYSLEEWTTLGRRIAHRAKTLLGEGFAYDPVNKVIMEPKMNELEKSAWDTLMTKVRSAADAGVKKGDFQGMLDALHQIRAAVDIAADVDAVPAPGAGEVADKLDKAATGDGKCPSCGAANGAGAKYCKDCGTKLMAEKGIEVHMTHSTPSTPSTPGTPSTPSTPSTPESSSSSSSSSTPSSASTPEVKKVVEEMLVPVTAQIAELTKLLATAVKQGSGLEKAAYLRKSVPAGDLNSLPSADDGPELTPLRKSILAAAGAVMDEGAKPSAIQAAMDAAGGNGNVAKDEALKMVRESLASRGITSANHIRVMNPATAAKIRQMITAQQGGNE